MIDMADLAGEKYVLAVAQQPFETNSDGNVKNMFCTLAPVVSLKGEPADSDDFPNAGLVWWLLRSGDRTRATPGRRVKATLEAAHRYDSANPQSTLYQNRSRRGREVLRRPVKTLVACYLWVTRAYRVTGDWPWARSSAIWQEPGRWSVPLSSADLRNHQARFEDAGARIHYRE